jgi:copper(I)-binding protein
MFAKLSMVLLALIFAAGAHAEEPSVRFNDKVVYPTAGKVGIGFFTVESSKNDAIIAASSECCKAVELHRNEKINGNMTMRRISELSLKKNKPVRVQPDSPGGEHLMLIGLESPLREGDAVTVTFTLKKAGAQTITFPVKPRPGSTTPDDNAGHDAHGE